MTLIRLKRFSAIAISLGLMMMGFQNCSKPTPAAGSTSGEQFSASGNGEGYSGKPDLFRRYDAQTCSELGHDGHPLPNDQIFYQSQTVGSVKIPHVVRRNCVDVAPQPLLDSDVKVDSSGGLNFKGLSFASYQRDNGFQVLAATCPPGKTAIANAKRTNLIVNSQDWTEQPVYQGWMWHAGIVANLNGSIKSLPAYTLLRMDPQFPEEFRRISQLKQLQSNTAYAFSFLAKKGTRDSINFRYYRVDEATGNEEYLIIDFNLILGVATIRLNDYLAPAQVTMTPVGEGYFCTVHFTTSSTGGENYSDFGFSPTAYQGVTHVGDTVFATAAQLETTSSFCQ